MKDQLLPCPFCGSTELEVDNSWTPHFSVECQQCGAEVPGHYTGSDEAFKRAHDCTPEVQAEFDRARASAVEAWNRRTPDAAQTSASAD